MDFQEAATKERGKEQTVPARGFSFMDAQASKDIPKKKKKEKKSSESKKKKKNDNAEAQISEDVEEFEPVRMPVDEEGFIQSFDVDQVDEFVQFFKRYAPFSPLAAY